MASPVFLCFDIMRIGAHVVGRAALIRLHYYKLTCKFRLISLGRTIGNRPGSR